MSLGIINLYGFCRLEKFGWGYIVFYCFFLVIDFNIWNLFEVGLGEYFLEGYRNK